MLWHNVPIILFLVSASLITLIPGPAMLLSIEHSSRFGWRAGMVTVLGLEFSTFLYVCATALGVAVLLIHSPRLYTWLQNAGAVYLIYLGIRAILLRRQSSLIESPTTTSNHHYKKLFFSGVLVNLFNPKMALFLIAFLPQFIPASDTDNIVLLFILGLIFNLLGILTNSLAVLLTRVFHQKFSGLLSSNTLFKSIATWFSGSLFILLGLYLLFT